MKTYFKTHVELRDGSVTELHEPYTQFHWPLNSALDLVYSFGKCWEAYLGAIEKVQG